MQPCVLHVQWHESDPATTALLKNTCNETVHTQTMHR